MLRHWSLCSVKSNRCAKIPIWVVYVNYLANISAISDLL